jgi:hypothetical protein
MFNKNIITFSKETFRGLDIDKKMQEENIHDRGND